MTNLLKNSLSQDQIADAYRRGIIELPYPPRELWIEPTNRCNLRCPKCPHATGLKRAMGIMSEEIFRDLIEEVSDWKPLISFHLGGESLLVPDLPDRIRLAAEHGMSTVLHSNGLLLTEDYSRRLIDSGLELLSVSVDGEDERSYREAMGGGNFNRLKRNVTRFLELRTSRSPFLVIRVTRPSPDKFPRADESPLAEWGADYLQIADQHVWSGADAERRRDLGLGLDGPLSACARIWYGMGILWDGTVVPCCMDMEGEHPIGSTRVNSVRAIWNGEAMVKLRRNHVAGEFGDIALCRNCDELREGGPHTGWEEAKGRMKLWLRKRAHSLFRPYG